MLLFLLIYCTNERNKNHLLTIISEDHGFSCYDDKSTPVGKGQYTILKIDTKYHEYDVEFVVYKKIRI